MCKLYLPQYRGMPGPRSGNISHLIMWPETTGKVTPLYLARRNSYFLEKFRWYSPLRPMSPAEVFDYPPEMAELAKQNILGRMSPDALTLRGRAMGKPAPKIVGLIPDENPSAAPEPDTDVSTGQMPEPVTSEEETATEDETEEVEEETGDE